MRVSIVNNAGSPVQRTSIEECSIELWNQVLATNLTSAFLVTRRAIPLQIHAQATQKDQIERAFREVFSAIALKYLNIGQA